ncbi:MAG: MarR family transcriptional regulator [Methanoregulaceae archaeon]
MVDNIRDRVAEDLLALLPFYHKNIIKMGHGISGLQAAQYRVLGVLTRDGTLPMSEIGKRLYISKPYMTTLVDTLISARYVERLPDSEDRRVIKIAITSLGKKHLKESSAIFKNNLNDLLSKLDEKDLIELNISLEKLKRILKKIS